MEAVVLQPITRGRIVVPYQSLTLTMLISAPGDVPDSDLQTVADTITRWNFRSGRDLSVPVTVVPISWSKHSFAVFGQPPQDALNEQLVDAADFGIALFANQLGTPTTNYLSGTAEEIERLHEAGKAVSIVRNPNVPVPSGAAPERVRLDEYFTSIRDRARYAEYSTPGHLVALLDNFVVAQAKKAADAMPAAGVDQGEVDRMAAPRHWPQTTSRASRRCASWLGRTTTVSTRPEPP